jgi:hypothetical protein
MIIMKGRITKRTEVGAERERNLLVLSQKGSRVEAAHFIHPPKLHSTNQQSLSRTVVDLLKSTANFGSTSFRMTSFYASSASYSKILEP